jgi:hypothetical protein
MTKGNLKKIFSRSLADMSFDNLIRRLHYLFSTLPDRRKGSNQSKSFNDAVMGAFALFYTQSPSFVFILSEVNA